MVGDVIARGHLGYNNHKVMEFLVLRYIKECGQENWRTETSGGEFGLFRRLVERLPWAAILKGKGVQEGWTCFKKEILKAQEHSTVPIC